MQNATDQPQGVNPCLQLASPQQVTLEGLLGEALEASRGGRLSHFIVDEHSPAIAVFRPEHTQQNSEGDWYGEHAGKWLYAAARAALRSDDSQLRASVRRVADYLIARQDSDGYLGNYAPERRFMRKQPSKPVSWDGAPALRTWDIWTHSYLILGLLEAHRLLDEPDYLQAACRIGDLCWQTLTEGGIDITTLGNHHGMSATVLMDPAVELYFATGQVRYLQLAERVAEQANGEPMLALLDRALAGADASEIATGKAYQLCWNLVGLAKLYRATGDARYRQAVDHLWQNIGQYHLSLGGGPWGGVAHRSREVFNPAGTFHPQAYVETCSVLAWIQLNRELLRITGLVRYADEIERSAYNDLLGAAAPDGQDWCYYSFPNGQRVHTTYWRCCKSSGAMALEELPAIAYALTADGGVQVNLYGESSARLPLAEAGQVRLRQRTGYPFAGRIRIEIDPERPARFSVRLRIPSWALHSAIAINGVAMEQAVGEDGWVQLTRDWQAGDAIELELPIRPQLHRRLNRNVQESRAPDGSPVAQQVLRYEYAAVTCGPLVYSTTLIDGFKFDETLKLPQRPLQDWLQLLPVAAGEQGAAIQMDLGYRPPLLFSPYYRAGGRHHGAWRLTWLSLAPDPAAQP